MTPKVSSAPGGVNVDLDLSYFLPAEGVFLDAHLIIIEDVRRVAQVADGLEAAAKALRAIKATHA